MTKTRHSLAISALTVVAGLVPAHAATIISGDLFFTTFQNQSGTATPLSTDVWKVSFVYDSAPTLTLAAPVAVKLLTGADGLIFDPNDATLKTLLVGEQNSNQVGQISTAGVTIAEKKADAANPQGYPAGYLLGQSYGITATPDKTKLLSMPNDPGFGANHINVSPLNPLADGVAHCVALPDSFVAGVAYRNGVAYYATATDRSVGYLGILDTTPVSPACFSTTRSTIIDDTGGGVVNGFLPAHGITYDSYSDCFILTSANNIWQVCAVLGDPANTFHIKAKVATQAACLHPLNNPACAFNNWDQTSVDAQGHLFAANNNGDMYFIDYKATKNIGTATFTSLQFLAVALDDIVNGGGAPPPPPGGCPATKGFWHDPSNHGWPDTSVTVGGVIYDGTTHSMTIGGKVYTQLQLLSLMPSAPAKGSGYVIAGSQLIAAVLNIAGGAQHGLSVDADIKAVNDLLSVDPRMVGTAPGVGTAINYTLPANNADLITGGGLLDSYNSAVGLNCTEATGLTLGKQPQPAN